MNPLFQMLNNTPAMANANAMMQKFQQFRQTFNGNPQQMVQQLLQSGKVSQEQYQNAMRLAQQMQGLLK
jgi:hypothetical protein